MRGMQPGYPGPAGSQSINVPVPFSLPDDPRVPADNNGCERDIRSLVAARNDGGTHRAEWSAAAFARIKSVIVTSLKNGLRFINYGLEVVRAHARDQPRPLPLTVAA